ncbi:MAG: ABC transporter ATP-binding protein [Coriobacteriia bacterium]|nr:ABC transporter ATP-binding protein [Coriobacteriia bacterium]
MHLLRKLAPHWRAVLLCLALLVVQAFGDLSLPRYTSLIVDVGIQQSGVEHASPDQLTASTHDQIAALLTQEQGGESAAGEKPAGESAAAPDGAAAPAAATGGADPAATDPAALFAAAYEPAADGTFALTEQGSAVRDQLDAVVAGPLAQIHGLTAADDAGAADPSLLQQQGIAAAQKEYQALGRDLGAMQMDYLLRTSAIMLGMAALIMAAMIAVSLVASRTGARIGRDLRQRLFARVMEYSAAEIDSFSAASLITRGTNDIQLIQNICTMLLRMVIYAPILALGGVVMVAATAPSMAWIIAIAVAVLLTVVGALMAITGPKFRIMQQVIDRVNQVAREVLTGLPVVRAFSREDHEQERFDQASTTLYRTQLFTNRAMTFMGPTMMLIMNGVAVAVVWFGGLRVSMGTLQTGQIIALITYSMVIIAGFLMISMISIMLPRANVAAQRVDQVLATASSVADPAEPQDALLPDAAQAPGARIEFRDVSFAYDQQGENALDHVSFTIPAGSTCAIVGGTGSGKSTVLQLIERFRDVASGQVLLDGVDVRDLSQAALRSQLGYVPQRAFLFSGTIRSNVGYGQDHLSDERLAEALRIAQAADFVAERPEGADAPIAQSGSNVSGGQRQRLAIARALAQPARAFLFDDSFSALDYRTDAALRQELQTSLAGRTVVIVAQRIATVMNADQILVLEDGRVVGRGTHAELLESCPEYRQIAESQLSPQELESALPASAAKGGDAQ